MTMTNEQSVGRALATEVARIALPPESRWIPKRTSPVAASATTLVLAAAFLMLVAGGIITDVRAGPRIVPATRPDPLAVPERAAWAGVQSELPTDGVLRPTWLPAGFRLPSAECTSLNVQIDRQNGGYTVEYLSKIVPGGECGSLTFRSYGKAVAMWEGAGAPADDLAHFRLSARGTVVYVSLDEPLASDTLAPARLGRIGLWSAAEASFDWIEDGVWYEIRSNDAAYADLVAVLRSLEPVH